MANFTWISAVDGDASDLGNWSQDGGAASRLPGVDDSVAISSNNIMDLSGLPGAALHIDALDSSGTLLTFIGGDLYTYMLRANSIIEVSSNATLHVAEMEDWVIMWSGSGSSVDIEMILGASSNITVDNGTITIGSDASLASLVIYGNSSINTTGTLVVQSLEVTSSFFADIRSTGTMDIYDVDITGSNIVAFTSSAGSIEIGSSNTDTYDCYEIVFNANNTLYWRSTGENCYLTRFVATADDLNINGFRHDTFLGRWFPGGYLRPGYMPVTYEISCNTIAAGYLSPSYDSIIVCNQYNASAWGFNYPSSVLLTINHKLVMSDDHGTKSFYTPQSPEVAPSNKVLFGTPNLGVGGLYKPPATVSVSRG